jgi:acetoin utilization protein AcuB
MFSIYGISGRVFNGPLESLNLVRAAARTAPVRAIAEDGEELGVEVGMEIRATRLQKEAVAAYRRVVQRDLDRGPLYHAAEIMTTSVFSLIASDSVATAWRSLRQRRIHQAPVIDNDAQLVGIVSERDLLTAIDVDGDRVIETLRRDVRDVMTTPVVAAEPVTDIRRIAQVMLDYGVDGVPITDAGGRLAGFVSRGDILRAVVTDPPVSLWR